MKVKDIIDVLNAFAPLAYQESYDNSGLQVGNIHQEVSQVLITLDVIEATIDEAIEKGCNLILSHHPLLFKPIHSLTGKHFIERILIKAIQHNIAIYSGHTNMDNMLEGVNQKIAQRLALEHCRILAPLKQRLLKLHCYVPNTHTDRLLDALFKAGAGAIGNYKECSYYGFGTGTFRPTEDAHPTIGVSGGPREKVQEDRIEVLVAEEKKAAVLDCLFEQHPYEEVAYGIIRLENEDQTKGAGLIGELKEAMPTKEFLVFLKERMKVSCIRHTDFHKQTVKTIALCGGSGSFLLPDALRQKADIFITGDFKYHQFFDTENKIIIADIGHYESEQFTIDLFSELLKKKFPNFAPYKTGINTNPIKYFY